MNPLFGTLRLLLGTLLLHGRLVDPSGELGKFGSKEIANQLAQKPTNTKKYEEKLNQEGSI